MARNDDDDLFGGSDEFDDDFGDFDGDFGDGDDFSLDSEKNRKTDNTPLGQARKYAGKAAAGAMNGVKAKLRDEFKETAGVFDAIDSGIDEAKMIKDKVTEDIKPVLNQTKILSRRLLKYGEDLVPSGLYKKLMEKLETEEEASAQKSPEQQKKEMRDQQLNDSLNSIFKAQMTERLASRRDDKIQHFMDRRMTQARHHESMQAMTGMEHSLQVLASFARGTQTAYMKKDLELKIRSLYFQEDTLIAIQNQNDLLKQKLEQIRHNTALPEVDKINLKERIKKQAYDTILGGLGGVLSNYGAKVSAKLMENVIGPVKDMVGTLPDAASMFLDGMEMSGNSKLSKKTLLGWGAHWLGGKVASAVTGKIVKKLPEEVKIIIENAMKQGGVTAALMLDELRRGIVPVQLRGLPDYLIEPAKKVAETLAPEIDRTAGRIENKAYSHPNDAGAITNRFISTVEDVIPGYLRMQLRSLEAIALGMKAPLDQVEEKHFDVKSREFVTTSTAKKRIFTEAFGTAEDRAYRVKQNIGAFTQSKGMKNLIEDMSAADQAEFKNTFANAASDLSMVIENLASSKSNNLSHFSITEINWMRQAIDPDGSIHLDRITNTDDRSRAKEWFDNAFRTGDTLWATDKNGDGPKRIARVVKLMNQMFEKTIDQDAGMQEAWLTMVTQDVSERVHSVMQDNDRYARTMDRLSNTYGWGSTVTNEFYQRGENGQAVYSDGLMVLDSNKFLDAMNGRSKGVGDDFHVLNSSIALDNPSKLFEKDYFDRDDKERDLYYQIRSEHPDWEDGKIWDEVKKQKKNEKFQKAALGVTNGIVRGLKQGLGGTMDYARKNFEFVDKAYQNIYAPAAEAIKGAGTFIKNQAGKVTDFVIDKGKAFSSMAIDAAYNFLTKESRDTKHVSFTHLAKILFVTEKDADGVTHAKIRKECPIELALDIVAHQPKVLNALRAIRKAIKENGDTMPVCKVLDLFMPLNMRKISEIDDITVTAIQNAETEDAQIALLRQYLNDYKVGARPVPPPSEAVVENVESPETSPLQQQQAETAGTPEDVAAVTASTQAEAETLNNVASGKATATEPAGLSGTTKTQRKKAARKVRQQAKAEPLKSAAEQAKENAVEKDIEQKYEEAIQAFKDFVDSVKNWKQEDKTLLQSLREISGEGRRSILALYDFARDSKARKFLAEKRTSDLALLDEIYQCFIKEGDIALLKLDALDALEDDVHKITPALRTAVQTYQDWCISAGIADIQEKYQGMSLTEILREVGSSLKDSATKKIDEIKRSSAYQKVTETGSGLWNSAKEIGSKAVSGAGKLFNASMERLATRDHSQILLDQLEVQQRILEHLTHVKFVGTAPSQVGSKIKTGAKTVAGKIWAGVTGVVKGMGWGAYGLAGATAKSITGALSATRHALTNRICNVYVAPESPDDDIDIQDPKIPAQEFERGNVFHDEKATKPVKSVADIRGVVYNSKGIPWITVADIKRGLVDENRKPISPFAARTGRLIYKGSHWVFNTLLTIGEKILNPNVLKATGALLMKSITAPFRLSGAIMHTFFDVFRADDMSQPLITKSDQEKKRVAFENGDEVKSTASIDGPLVWVGRTAESKGSKYAISVEDFEAGLVDQFGEPINAFTRRIGLLLNKGIRFGVSLGGHFLSGGLNVVTTTARLIGKATKALFKSRNPFRNVYVRSEADGSFDPDFPRLIGAKIRSGAYFYEDGTKLTSAYGIKEPVYELIDGKPEVVISASEIDRLCDSQGKPVTAMAGRSIAMKALTLAGSAVSWGIQKAFKTAKAVFKGVGNVANFLTKGIFEKTKDTLGLVYGGLKDILGTVFHGEGVLGRKDLQEVVGDKLEDIYILLHDTLKPKAGDADNDGDRDGGYADYKQHAAERRAKYEKKQEEAKKAKEAREKKQAEAADRAAADKRHQEQLDAIDDAGGASLTDWLLGASTTKDLLGSLKNSKWGRRIAGVGKLFGKAKNSAVGKGITSGTGKVLSSVFGANGAAGKAAGKAMSTFGGAGGKAAAATLAKTGWSGLASSTAGKTLSAAGAKGAGAAVSKLGLSAASKAGLGALAGMAGKALASAATGVGVGTTIAMLAAGAFAVSKWAGKKIWYMFADTPSEKEWTKLRLRQYGMTASQEDDIEDLEEDMLEVFDREREPLSDDDLEDYAEDLGFLDLKQIAKAQAALDKSKQERLKKRQAYMQSKAAAEEKAAKEGTEPETPPKPSMSEKELDEKLPDSKDLRMQYFNAWMQERFAPIFASYVKIVRYYGHGKPGDDVDPSDIDDELQTTAQKLFMQQTTPIVGKTKDLVPTVEGYQKWRHENAEKLIAAAEARKTGGGAPSSSSSNAALKNFAAKSTEDKLKSIWTGYRTGYNKVRDAMYKHWYTAPLGWVLSAGNFLINDTLEFLADTQLGHFVGGIAQQIAKRGLAGGVLNMMFGRNDREQQWFEARCKNYGFTSTGVDMSGDAEDAIEKLEKLQFAVDVGESPEVTDDELWDFGRDIDFLPKSTARMIFDGITDLAKLNFGTGFRLANKAMKTATSDAKRGLDTEQKRKDFLTAWYQARFCPVYEIYMKLIVAASEQELGSEPDPKLIDDYRNEEVLQVFDNECTKALSSALRNMPYLAPTEEAYQTWLEQLTKKQNEESQNTVDKARKAALDEAGGNIATNLTDAEKEVADMEASNKTNGFDYTIKKVQADRDAAAKSDNLALLGNFQGMSPEEIKRKLSLLGGKYYSGELLKWVGTRIEGYGWKKSDFKPDLLEMIDEFENDHINDVFESISPDKWSDDDITEIGEKLGIIASSGNWFTNLFSSKKEEPNKEDAENRKSYVKNWLIGRFYPIYKMYYDVLLAYGAAKEGGIFTSNKLNPLDIEMVKREEAYRTFLAAIKPVISDPELKKYVPTPEGYEAFTKGEKAPEKTSIAAGAASVKSNPAAASKSAPMPAPQPEKSEDEKKLEQAAQAPVKEITEGTPEQGTTEQKTEVTTAEDAKKATPQQSAALQKALEFIREYKGKSLFDKITEKLFGLFGSDDKKEDPFLDARGKYYGFDQPKDSIDIISSLEDMIKDKAMKDDPEIEDGDLIDIGATLGLIDQKGWKIWKPGSLLDHATGWFSSFKQSAQNGSGDKEEQEERLDYIRAWYGKRFFPVFRSYILILDGYGAVQHNFIRADKLLPEKLSDTDREAALKDFEKAVASLNITGDLLKLIPTADGYLAYRKAKDKDQQTTTRETELSGADPKITQLDEDAAKKEKQEVDNLSGALKLAMQQKVDQAKSQTSSSGSSFLSGLGDKLMNGMKNFFTPDGDDRPDDGTAKQEDKGFFAAMKDAIMNPGKTMVEAGRSIANMGDNAKVAQDLSGLSGAKIPDGGAGDLGSYVKKFESGNRGPSAIGYDSTGGTSYGSYQIATKTGTMKNFLAYAKKNGGEFGAKLADALGAAGQLNTGSRNGPGPQIWKQFAGVDGGEALHKLEKGFIKATHYDVALSKLPEDAKAAVERDRGLKESLWSTAVQHGPGGAASIFKKAYKPGIKPEDWLKAIYAARSGKFGSSSASVRQSVINRFKQELPIMLGLAGVPAESEVDDANKSETAGGSSGSDQMTGSSAGEMSQQAASSSGPSPSGGPANDTPTGQVENTPINGSGPADPKAVDNYINIARKNAQGAKYSQANRFAPKNYDCSSFVARTLTEAGFNVPATNTTATLGPVLQRAGFEKVSGPVGDASQLQPGDIMLRPSTLGHGHTEIYTGNGKSVGAHSTDSGVSERNHWKGYNYTEAYRLTSGAGGQAANDEIMSQGGDASSGGAGSSAGEQQAQLAAKAAEQATANGQEAVKTETDKASNAAAQAAVDDAKQAAQAKNDQLLADNTTSPQVGGEGGAPGPSGPNPAVVTSTPNQTGELSANALKNDAQLAELKLLNQVVSEIKDLIAKHYSVPGIPVETPSSSTSTPAPVDPAQAFERYLGDKSPIIQALSKLGAIQAASVQEQAKSTKAQSSAGGGQNVSFDSGISVKRNSA